MTAFVGFILLFGVAIGRLRETLRVDDPGIHHEFRSAFRTFRWHAPRDAARRVTLKAILESSGESTTTEFTVALEVAVEDLHHEFPFFQAGKEPRARRTAEAVARALRLPLVDAIGDKEDVAPYGAHQQRRPEQGAPEGPPPARVEQDFRADRPALVIHGTIPPIHARRFHLVGWGFTVSSLGVGFLSSRVMDPPWMGWVIPFAFWGAGLYSFAYAFVGAHARERVRVQQGELVRDVEFAGRRWQRKANPRDAVQRLRVQTGAADARGVALLSAEDRIVVGASLEAAELEWVLGWLSQQLG